MDRSMLHKYADACNRLTNAQVLGMRCYDSLPAVSAVNWSRFGRQSVVMPATYEAGLMASDVLSALDEEEPLPWPAFEIQVGSRVLFAKSEVFSVLVSEIPGWMLVRDPNHPVKTAKIIVTYLEKNGISTANWYTSLRNMFDAEAQANEKSMADSMSEARCERELAAYSEVDVERRIWTMVARLVSGVVLAVNQSRQEDPRSFVESARERKRPGRKKGKTWALGKPLDIDVRRSVSDYVSGTRQALSTQHLRRGHWRNQPYGEGNAMRRRQWIKPAWVGDGPLLRRPVRLGHTATEAVT